MKNLKLTYLICFIIPIVTGCNHVKEPLWTVMLKGNGLPPTLKYADTNVLVVSYLDTLLCFDNKTGKTMVKSESGPFSKIYFDAYLYFFKDDDLFIKINPFQPKEKWELYLKNSIFNTRSIFKKDNKIYLDGFDKVYEINADSLQINETHSYSIKENVKKGVYAQRIYLDDKNICYIAYNKLYINTYGDSIGQILIDSVSIYNEFTVILNYIKGYYILDDDRALLKIYKLEDNKELLKVHEAKGVPFTSIAGLGNSKNLAYQSGEHVIVYSLETGSILLEYSFRKRIGGIKVYDDLLVISEIVERHDHNRSTIYFIDIRDGHQIRKIKFDSLVYEFEIVDDKIYYTMDNRVSCSQI